MKKKIFAVLITVVAIFATVCFAACGEHEHDYKNKLIDPTCTEIGHMMRVCDCGDIYDDYELDAKGHNVVDGVCTTCGGVDPIITTDDGLVFILKDDGKCYYVKASDTVQGNIVVPATVKNKPVTRIDYKAFYNCSNLTGITIPNSVTTICDYAFFQCSSLISITIPQSVTSIGEGAFCGCSSELETIAVDANNASYKSENNCLITKDGKNLILGCKNSIIPSSVTTIGYGAFDGCSSLTSIVIPKDVISIGNAAFYHCSGLTSITLPNGVTSIGESAFCGCSRLTNIAIPKGVTVIDRNLFWECHSLTSVTIPNSVTEIKSDAFYDCGGLTDIYFDGNKYNWEYNIKKVLSWNFRAGDYTVHCTDGDLSRFGSSILSP